MEAEEIKLIQVARRLSAIALQLVQAYDLEQRKLDLSQVLTRERLSSLEGTAESLACLEQLRRLTGAHRQVYAQFLTETTRQVTDELKAVSEEKRVRYEAQLITDLNFQMKEQSEFYLGRARWIEAAEGICHLVNAHREECTFGEAIEFASSVDVKKYNTFLQVIDEVHRAEVARFEQRKARIQAKAAILAANLEP